MMGAILSQPERLHNAISRPTRHANSARAAQERKAGRARGVLARTVPGRLESRQ